MTVSRNCSLLLISRPLKDEKLNWLAYNRQFTQISDHSSAAGRAQDRQSDLVCLMVINSRKHETYSIYSASQLPPLLHHCRLQPPPLRCSPPRLLSATGWMVTPWYVSPLKFLSSPFLTYTFLKAATGRCKQFNQNCSAQFYSSYVWFTRIKVYIVLGVCTGAIWRPQH